MEEHISQFLSFVTYFVKTSDMLESSCVSQYVKINHQ